MSSLACHVEENKFNHEKNLGHKKSNFGVITERVQ